MSTTITPNRNYTHPEKDEDLQASNVFFKTNLFAIDSDIHTLFTEKANAIDVYTKTESDTNLSTAISEYDAALDIYGEYTTGDVRGTTSLLLNDVNSTPGVATKVTVNAKGLVVGTGIFIKSDITDFNESDYMQASVLDDTSTDTSHILSASKVISLIGVVGDSQGNYVPLSSYTDADVLSKLLNVDGAGTGLDSDKLDGEDGSFYLDFNNFSNKPSSVSGYGITDASINSVQVISPLATSDIDCSAGEVHSIILDKNISFSVSNLVQGQRGSIIITNADTSFDVLSGLQSGDTSIDVGNFSSGVSSDLVGQDIKIIVDGSPITRNVVSESSGTLTLDSSIPAATSDTGTGQTLFTLTFPSNMKFPGGASLVCSADIGSINKIDFVTVGTDLLCVSQNDFK